MVDETVLDVRDVTKSYSGQVALAGVDFAVSRGQVHALVGQNGSGKSTLIKTLAGYQDPDSYSYAAVDGAAFRLGSVEEASALGLRFIHQNLGLLPNMSAIENCALARGFHTAPGYRIRWRQERRRVHHLLSEFGVEVDPDRPVSELRPAERTAIAIVRALQDWEERAKVLVLDEATASLPTPEVRRLFQVIRQVSAKGIGVVYVSHRLGEIFEIADQVTVLRDGHNVGSWAVSDIDHNSLVSQMIGRPADLVYAEPPPPSSDVVLKVDHLRCAELDDLTFSVCAGEIVGFAGILGSGREVVAPLLSGALGASTGTMTVGDTVLVDPSPTEAIRAGVALVPADRGSQGVVAHFTVAENMTITEMKSLVSHGCLSRSAERREARRWIDRFAIVPADSRALVSTMSGGNQQKVVLAKWLRTGPRVLVLDEPTHGVDVGAKAAIYGLIAERLRDGLAAVMCSTESEDLAYVCDRVFVLRNGAIAAELHGAELTADRITHESLGSSAN